MRRLHIRAAEYGRSMEEEAQDILRHVVTEPARPAAPAASSTVGSPRSPARMAPAWPATGWRPTSPPLTATSRRLLDALLAEALVPADVAEMEAAE